jgi:hypothetical protein
MKKWMKRLAEQHRQMRQIHPKDNVMVVFDIDDTVLDLRHMIRHVLHSYDRRHGTRHFQELNHNDIWVSEFAIRRIIDKISAPHHEKSHIVDWFKSHAWSSAVIRDGHKPFPGAMDVIRWLKTQPRTFVGLNTGRPETMRRDTLHCLHNIGKPHHVTFPDNLVFMNPYGWGKKIIESKVEGIQYFEDIGFKIAAFVDNEPENLQAVADYDKSGEILLVHADTVFDSERTHIPPHAVSGNIYDVAVLAGSNNNSDEFGKAA